RLPAGQTLEAERIYEIQRFQIITHLDPKTLVRPGVKSRALRGYLGSTPGIETSDRDLKKLAEDLGSRQKSPWEFTQTAAEWIGKNVKYQQGPYRGAEFAYNQRLGDCEDFSALLIALCRIAEIPARTVWVKGHAYPEFYLEDDTKQGHWIPVQLLGPEAFGNLNEAQPILQKGDAYRDPVTRKTVRYLPQQAVAYGGRAKLSISQSIVPDKSKSEPATRPN
ncbi:MAG: transglutaminase domain-containing protein, partial [Planctomycetaceae bacterium]|nr:transglutaminase domain-containing protein [Planctomycetaceae bacterium]